MSDVQDHAIRDHVHTFLCRITCEIIMPAFWLSKHSMDKYANENYFLDNTYLLRPLDFAMAIPGFAFC